MPTNWCCWPITSPRSISKPPTTAWSAATTCRSRAFCSPTPSRCTRRMTWSMHCWWTTARGASVRRSWISGSLSGIRRIRWGRAMPMPIMPMWPIHHWTNVFVTPMRRARMPIIKIHCTTATSARSAGPVIVSAMRVSLALLLMPASSKPPPPMACANVWPRNFPACTCFICAAINAPVVRPHGRKAARFSAVAAVRPLLSRCWLRTLRLHSMVRFISMISATTSAARTNWRRLPDTLVLLELQGGRRSVRTLTGTGSNSEMIASESS